MRKWKWNWGTGIALALGIFALGMGYAIFRAFGTHYSLVREDYYAAEVQFQETIEGQENAATLDEPCRFQLREGRLSLDFPEELEGKKSDINLKMYYQTDDRHDFNFREEGWTIRDWEVPSTSLISGKWTAKIRLEGMDRPYYFEPSITLP